MHTRLFGTDGIRGKANTFPMTVEVCMALGEIFGKTLGPGKILIGRDTRASGPVFEDAVIAGLAAAGCNPTPVGIIPTPGIAALVISLGASGGIVISASHNPHEDNGLKVFGPDGYKLSAAEEAKLDEAIQRALQRNPTLPPTMGTIESCEDGLFQYIHALSNLFKGTLQPNFPIVIDCANGAAFQVAPRIFKLLDIPAHALATQPNGTNINDGCGAMHPEHCAKNVLTRGCQLGIAFDGDADRAIFVDERGKVVPGEIILALLAEYGSQAKDTPLITTVMANSGLDDYLKTLKIPVIRTDVGDRYVAEAMKEHGAAVGGEESGHIILAQYSTTGDGILASLEVIRILQQNDLQLSEYRKGIQLHPRCLLSFVVDKKLPLGKLPKTQALIRKLEADSSNPLYILIRPSGTENKMRVLVEGADEIRNQNIAQEIKKEMLSELG